MSCREPKIEVDELSTPYINCIITDEDDKPVPASQISSLTMKLINDDTDAVINNRNGVEMKTFVDENGIFSFRMQALDNVIIDPVKYPPGKHEPHRMLLLLNAPEELPGQDPIEKMIYVRNLKMMPIT